MKKKILIFIVSVIMAIGVSFIYNNKFEKIDLTSKEENRTFVVHKNQEHTNDSMSFDFKGFTGKWSFFQLDCKKGSEITIKDNSNIDKGKFYIVVLDSNYEKIAMKEEKEKKDIEFVTPKDGKYFIRIVGKKASGRFDIKINSDTQIQTAYKDFFED